jgi:hypothetical protein
MPKIQIRADNISEPKPGTVVLQNSVLRNLLIQKQPAALEWLTTRVGPVNVNDISIDDQGRVVIADKAFAEEISKMVKTGRVDAAGDTACSNGSC